ncbi:hypothetical protein KCP75_16735 [Salmonella enterica subsp. enterica]|nr:hypothetical protein KCP75_16735 [Salmonella enterica subsp. enterica]
MDGFDASRLSRGALRWLDDGSVGSSGPVEDAGVDRGRSRRRVRRWCRIRWDGCAFGADMDGARDLESYRINLNMIGLDGPAVKKEIHWDPHRVAGVPPRRSTPSSEHRLERD